MEALRDALIERDELVGEEILEVIRRADHVTHDEIVTVVHTTDAPGIAATSTLVSPSTPTEDA